MGKSNLDILAELVAKKTRAAGTGKAPATDGGEIYTPGHPGGDTGGTSGNLGGNAGHGQFGTDTGDTTGQGTNEGHGTTGNEDTGNDTGTGTDTTNTGTADTTLANIDALLQQLMAGMTDEEQQSIIDAQNAALDADAARQKQTSLEDLAARGLDFSTVVNKQQNDINATTARDKQQVRADVEKMNQQKKAQGAQLAVQLQSIIEQAREADMGNANTQDNNSSNFWGNLLSTVGTILAGFFI